MKQPLIILTGPTAVGKTKLSIALAKAVNGEIISCDSMQVYKYMDIGSAKITKKEMEDVTHHLIDVLDPKEDFSVAKFQELALEAMEAIYTKGKIPILVGGTGFYIQSIVKGIDFTKTQEDTSIRERLVQLAKEHGAEYLHERLQSIDQKASEEIHPNNIKRVIRALEYFEQTGNKISEHNEEQKEKSSPYNFAYFVLNDHRNLLYQRIEQRIDEMLQEGLVEEVMALKGMGFDKGMVSMQGLGYKEILSYLDGTYTLDEAVEILKRDTRHFAKRQLTWFRREPDVLWVNKYEFDYNDQKLLAYMLSKCKEKELI